jgi:hypothetical protein
MKNKKSSVESMLGRENELMKWRAGVYSSALPVLFWITGGAG